MMASTKAVVVTVNYDGNQVHLFDTAMKSSWSLTENHSFAFPVTQLTCGAKRKLSDRRMQRVRI